MSTFDPTVSKRLQVTMPDQELLEIQQSARQAGLTASEWVRQSLRQARRASAAGDPARKLAVVRAAAEHDFPTAEITDILAQIQLGYLERRE